MPGSVIVEGVPGGDRTANLQRAIDAAGSDGTVYVPAGTWRHGPLTFAGTGGLRLMGAGRFASKLEFVPTADHQVGLALERPGGRVSGCQIENIGLRTTDTKRSKAALKIVDGANTTILSNVNIFGFGGDGTDSIGLWVQGRESLWAEQLSINANIPVYLDKNPNTVEGYLSVDHFTFSRTYFQMLNATDELTRAHMLINPGAHISQLAIEHGAWSGGNAGHGIHWDMGGTKVRAYSTGLVCRDLRIESQGPSAAWGCYLNLNPNTPLRNFSLHNCQLDAGRNGYYCRGVDMLSLEDCSTQHGGVATASVIADIDGFRAHRWRNVSTLRKSGQIILGRGYAEQRGSGGYTHPHTATWEMAA